MVKARKGDNIIIGLSDENMKRLKKGEPIRFNLKELHAGDITVYIFNGRTEDSMALTMQQMGNPKN